MHRLFAALRPPPAVRALLAATMHGVPGARWQDDDQLHLTLRFLGTVDRPMAEDAAFALEQVHAAPIALALAGVGRFEHRGRTEALWAGVAPHDALAALHRKVDQALVRAGLAPERRAYLRTSRSPASRARPAPRRRSRAGWSIMPRWRAGRSR